MDLARIKDDVPVMVAGVLVAAALLLAMCATTGCWDRAAEAAPIDDGRFLPDRIQPPGEFSRAPEAGAFDGSGALCGTDVDWDADGRIDYATQIFRNHRGEVVREELDEGADGVVERVTFYERSYEDGRVRAVYIDGGQGALPDGIADWEEHYFYDGECD